MSRYGAPQGVKRGTGRTSGGRLGRVVGSMLGVMLVLALVLGGTVLLLSRAWFVGDDDGAVALYRGVPSQVAGVPLSRVVDTTEVALDDLPPRRAERIRQGVTFDSQREAARYIDDLREELAESEEDDEQDDADGPDTNDADTDAERTS